MSRLRYLVSYDISDPKRLRKVARSLEGFGVRLQYSVFECPLDDLRLAKLKAELQGLAQSRRRSGFVCIAGREFQRREFDH
jgi:CRISPR-associated protein Cas2